MCRLRSGIEVLLSLLLPQPPAACASVCSGFGTCPAIAVGLSCVCGVWMSNCCAVGVAALGEPSWPGGRGGKCARRPSPAFAFTFMCHDVCQPDRFVHDLMAPHSRPWRASYLGDQSE